MDVYHWARIIPGPLRFEEVGESVPVTAGVLPAEAQSLDSAERWLLAYEAAAPRSPPCRASAASTAPSPP